MKTRVMIRLDSADLANPSRLVEAFNLVGGATLADRANAKERVKDRDRGGLDSKPFGRIMANDFTMADVHEAISIIDRRRSEMLSRLEETMFSDPQLQVAWADGVRANAEHAKRLAEAFVRDLKTDMKGMR